MPTLLLGLLFPPQSRIDHAEKTDCRSESRISGDHCSNLAARDVKGVPRFIPVSLADRNDTFEISVRVVDAVIYRTILRIMLQATAIGFRRALADGVVNIVSFGGLSRVGGSYLCHQALVGAKISFPN